MLSAQKNVEHYNKVCLHANSFSRAFVSGCSKSIKKNLDKMSYLHMGILATVAPLLVKVDYTVNNK